MHARTPGRSSVENQSGFPRCPLTQSVDHPHPVDLNGHRSTPPNTGQEKNPESERLARTTGTRMDQDHLPVPPLHPPTAAVRTLGTDCPYRVGRRITSLLRVRKVMSSPVPA